MANLVEIKAKYDSGNRDEENKVIYEEALCTYNFGESLDELVEKFGSEIVFDKACASMIIDIQALMRRCKAAGKSDEECQELVNSYTPGKRQAISKDPITNAINALKALTPEEQAAKIAELQAMLASLGK